MTMTIKVGQLSAMFEDINSGNYKRVNQIDDSTWECNGLWIEWTLIGGESYTVWYRGDYHSFDTFGDAVRFCQEAA